MKTEVKKIENCKTIVTLSSNGSEWNEMVEKAYTKLEANVSIKGFRKGKAPKEMVRSKINLEEVFNEAINFFLRDNYTKVLKDNELHPVTQPSIEVSKVSLSEFECNIVVVGEPVVDLGEYKGIKVNKDVVAVSNQDVEDEIKKLQEQNIEMNVKEEGKVETNDIATIDFEGFVDGVSFEGGKGENYDLEIGSNTFIPGFEEQLIGMSVNETKDVNVTFPENYVEHLKGKPATFKVTVKAIKVKVLPEINDDLAIDANIDNVSNLEELKKYYLDKLTKEKEEEVKEKAYNDLIDGIVSSSKITIADEIIEDEVKNNVNNIENRLSSQGLALDSYLAMISMSKDDFMTKLRNDCVKNLNTVFTLLAVARKENIKVSEEDFNKAYTSMASQYGMSVEDVKKALANRVEALANDLLLQKVGEYLKTENSI